MSSGRKKHGHGAGSMNADELDQSYTNEDIHVLHDIVILAEELLPTLPERERLPTNALFGAYHDILPRLGLRADHDSRYARILFKIGGLRVEGSLYDKFQEILSRMGIEIEFDDIIHDSGDRHDIVQTDGEGTDAGDIHGDEQFIPRGRQRRNSDSAWDIGSDHPPARQRRKSHSPPNKDTPRAISDNRNFEQPLQGGASIRAIELPDEEFSTNEHVGAWLESNTLPLRRPRDRSVSTQASFRIHRRLPLNHGRPVTRIDTPEPTSDEYHAEGEITAVTSAHGQDEFNGMLGQVPSNLCSSLLQSKVEDFAREPRYSNARHQLRVWREKALWLQKLRDHYDRTAINHDRKVLMFQVMDEWRTKAREKRRLAEEEKCHRGVERKTDRLRVLFVLGKAFCAWHTAAVEEAHRTKAARRHILRFRIFNAWRDITTVNELKVEKHVLGKFFGKWKDRRYEASSKKDTAVQRYETNLVERLFLDWLARARGIKATNWWAERVKDRVLAGWAQAARTILENSRLTKERRRSRLLLGGLTSWRRKLEELNVNEDYAANFRQVALTIHPLRTWRRETQYVPAQKTLRTAAATRALRDAFALWRHRTQQEMRATEVDNMRMLREAVAKWRHETRLRYMVGRVNCRVVSGNLKRWQNASRAAAFRTWSTQLSLVDTLHGWAARAYSLKRKRIYQEYLAEQMSTRSTQTLISNHWSARAQARQQLDSIATNFHASRLLKRVFSQMTEKIRHIRQLQQWSQDANFYFVASKTLKKWEISKEESKREKRKNAYAEVRRTGKMNTARGILSSWRSKAHDITQLQNQAKEVSRNKVVVLAMECFDRWRARTEDIVEMEQTRREVSLRNIFTAWKARSAALQDLAVVAVLNFQERQQSQSVKIWRRSNLQLRAQDILGSEIQERNAKGTIRKMLAYWHHQAMEKRPIDKRVPEMGGTARAEAWSEFGDDDGDEWARGLEEASSSTPAPGYLSTPSRRADRVAAAAARFSSTTPRAPLSTPFERQLRAQYSGGSLPSLRKPLGKSMLGIGGGFVDIAKSTNGEGSNL